MDGPAARRKPEQVCNLRPDFVVETFQALTKLIEESLYP